MLQKLFGFGARARGTGTPSGAAGSLHPAMVAELLRFEHYRAGLGRDALQYVASGEGGQVLHVIDRLGQANLVYNTPYQQAKPSVSDMHAATARALVTGEIEPGPELLRLVQVRVAAKHVSQPWGQTFTPLQFAIAGLSAMLFQGLSQVEEQYKVRWAEVIPLKTVLAHFRQIGGTMADMFGLILRRHESAYPDQTAGSWSAGAELADYLRTYPAAFAEATRLAEPKPRANAFKLIEFHKIGDLPEIEQVLVAMLTRPFGKDDRALATSALARLPAGQLAALLRRDLPTADIDARHGLVIAGGRSGAAEVVAVLAERAKVEKAGKVSSAIAAVLEAAAPAAPGDPATEAEPGYTAVDGSHVALPPRKELGVEDLPAPSESLRREFLGLVERIEDERVRAHYAYAAANPGHSRAAPRPWTPEEIDACFATLTGAARRPEEPGGSLLRVIRHQGEGQAWLRAILAPLPLAAAKRLLLASHWGDVAGLIGTRYAHGPAERFGVDMLHEWIEQQRIDLRDLATPDDLRDLLTRQNYGNSSLYAIAALPPEGVWPWLVDNMEVLDEAIGLRPTQRAIALQRTLEVLAMLPALPQRYFGKVLEIAVAEKRPLRRQAIALLRGAKDLVARVEALLDDKRQQVRINAAAWLADMRSTASEKALRTRLKKEKSDPVRAVLIESLQRMGFDLSDVIGPASLIAEADAALAKSAPELPDWLIMHGVPAAHFRDGSTVPDHVLRHWLALAIRLKDPGASGQFGIYLDQLDPENARSLSNWVLDSWITYDTRIASLEEATAYAQANYQSHFNWMYNPQKTPALRDQVIARMIREKQGELLNSGSDTKGMLALACRADPVFAANRVRWFLKKHGRRSNQAMALLEVLAGIGQPAALQVVIAASARLKQKSTQARAAEIAERYAEDRGWTLDELADRTVPSAGLDDDGVLELPCGEDEKLYTARLDAALAIHLFNPEDKPVKGLPAGDDEQTRESKKALTAAKKELAQVIEMQATRLFEAMCVERSWPVADWRMSFHEHPVMRRLVERLVWQGLDEEGNPGELFRPTQEGDFTDAADQAIEIDRFAAVRLAHGALVDAACCAAWLAHLKDYEVKPFLAQFDTLRAPLSAEQGEEEAILDRQGWTANSLTLRGVAEKRGYERIMRDGGGCNEYAKSFASHGITATVFHTGSYAVDENNPVALKELRFTKAGHRGPFRLKDVPPVMLAECWADYHAIAAKGAFQADWEKIAPW